MSPTGEYLAFGDADGVIHLLSTSFGEDDHHHPFNGFDGQPIEWADAPEALPDIQWSDTTYGIFLIYSIPHSYLPSTLSAPSIRLAFPTTTLPFYPVTRATSTSPAFRPFHLPPASRRNY